MKTTVKHGRRSGNLRDYPNNEFDSAAFNLNNKSQSAKDLRQITILGKNDWNRIQTQLNRRAIEEDRLRELREERENLHKISKEKVKNWTNTVAGQRQKKLEARAIREKKDEEDRKQIDIEEAIYQAEQRKEAIERAKIQQYYQTDRVKKFHGALLLTEVLKERDAQLELKRLREEASKGQDNNWLQQAQQNYEQSILRDQEQASERIRKNKQTAEFQKEQIQQHINERERDILDEKLEGNEMKKYAAQFEMEKKKLQEIRENENKLLMRENLLQIDDVKKMRQIHKEQEDEEDEECRIFAAAKRKMMKLRAEKEKQLHSDKQKSLEKIREKLYTQMQQKIDDEDDRIERAAEEREARKAKEELEKEEFNKKAQREMDEHRDYQMRERKKRQSEERRKEYEMLSIRKQADEVFQQNENEKRQAAFERTKELEGYLLKQIDDKLDIRVKDKEQELSQDKRNQDLIQLEEKQFRQYADRVIDHCKQGGRNVYPLQQAAREGAGGGLGPVFPGKGGLRPSYMVADRSGVQMPNYQRSTTEDIKMNINGKDQTEKRLGFVW